MITANHCDTCDCLTMCLEARNYLKSSIFVLLGRLARVGCLTAKRILGMIGRIPFAE